MKLIHIQAPLHALTTLRRSVTALYQNGTLLNPGDVEFISELQRPDADLTIYHLSAPGIVFVGRKTADAWYRATKQGSFTGEDYPYFQDEPASPLACAQQEQVCNPNLPEDGRCTPLSGVRDLRLNAAALRQDESSSNRMEWLLNTLSSPYDTSVYRMVRMLGSQSLASKDSMMGQVQGSLPDNQWQLDVQHWLAVSLVSLQKHFLTTARGPEDSRLLPAVKRPSTPEARAMCGQQVSSSFL